MTAHANRPPRPLPTWLEAGDFPSSRHILDLGDGRTPALAGCADVDVPTTYVSSRLHDVAQAAELGVLTTVVLESLKSWTGPSFDCAVYAPGIAETKLRVFEWIDDAFAHLEVGGHLLLAGERRRGIESYRERVGEVYGAVEKRRQAGRRRLYTAQKTTERPGVPPVEVSSRFEVSDIPGGSFVFETKAGVFSRDHIDPGSRALLEAVKPEPTDRIADVGCGYGAIGIPLARLGNAVTLIDDDLRSIACTRKNLRLNAVEAKVLTSDLFASVGHRRFDLVVSNPPFHAGQAVSKPLIGGAHAHLDVGGRLWMVVMRATPYATAIGRVFGNVQTVSKTDSYTILTAHKQQA